MYLKQNLVQIYNFNKLFKQKYMLKKYTVDSFILTVFFKDLISNVKNKDTLSTSIFIPNSEINK